MVALRDERACPRPPTREWQNPNSDTCSGCPSPRPASLVYVIGPLFVDWHLKNSPDYVLMAVVRALEFFTCVHNDLEVRSGRVHDTEFT